MDVDGRYSRLFSGNVKSRGKMRKTVLDRSNERTRLAGNRIFGWLRMVKIPWCFMLNLLLTLGNVVYVPRIGVSRGGYIKMEGTNGQHEMGTELICRNSMGG